MSVLSRSAIFYLVSRNKTVAVQQTCMFYCVLQSCRPQCKDMTPLLLHVTSSCAHLHWRVGRHGGALRVTTQYTVSPPKRNKAKRNETTLARTARPHHDAHVHTCARTTSSLTAAAAAVTAVGRAMLLCVLCSAALGCVCVCRVARPVLCSAALSVHSL